MLDGHVGGVWKFGFADVVECIVVLIWWCAVEEIVDCRAKES